MVKLILAVPWPRSIFMTETFIYRSKMPASAEAVYRFHAEPDALERLTPPWEKAQVVARTGSIEHPGSTVTLRVSLGPFSQNWIAEHVACEPNKMFRDAMRTGPFRKWEHTHTFVPETDRTSWIEDFVEYEFPLGWLGKFIGGAYTHRRLQRMFEWRHKVTAEQLAARTAMTKELS
jgi:ligand-binding SRPBCC domain-containing protein